MKTEIIKIKGDTTRLIGKETSPSWAYIRKARQRNDKKGICFEEAPGSV